MEALINRALSEAFGVPRLSTFIAVWIYPDGRGRLRIWIALCLLTHYTFSYFFTTWSSQQYITPMAATSVTIESGATWEEVAAEMQKYRDTSIAAVQPSVPDLPAGLPPNVSAIPEQLLHGGEVEITVAPPEEILLRLASRKISAKHVVTAFLRRAGLAQKLVLSASAPFFSIPN